MKARYIRLLVFILVVFTLNVTAAFALEDQKAALVNMKTIPMGEVETLVINSSAELLVLLESKNSSVVIKEYQDESRKRDNNQNGGNRSFTSIIQSDSDDEFEYIIESITRTPSSPTDGYIEVYIPSAFRGAFAITAAGGIIRSEVDLNSARSVDITITNGDLELKQVSAGEINIAVSSGSFQAEKLIGTEINLRHTSGSIEIGKAQGVLSIEAVSGPITVRELIGGGNIVTQAGTIDVGLRNAMNDFSCALSTGTITITTPVDLFFNLDVEAGSGSITVTPPRGTPITTQGAAQWNLGAEADITISARISTGSVTIGPGNR
ncbi:MAG: DUF4097 domain-containing protein [Spirochaetaceae bacterium]|jgi:DUF4097 and DUF4098 domain-containing protein YvlB|nr:DUF4097 domain-containing protein [Spirochaetaceae bacterium]